MKPYYSTPDGRAKLYLGDAIEVMTSFPDACVDAIVTDPPYGLEFMGKEWDKFRGDNVIMPPQGAYERKKGFDRMVRHLSSKEGLLAYQSWTTAWATEAYRILKPGAYMLVMGGTRTHHRLGCGLEDAGFEIRDELAWIYASGFPKNYDVSKGMDKKAGAEREVVGIKPGHEEFAGRKTDGHILAFKGTLGGEGGFDRPWMEDDEKREQYHKKTAPATPEARYWEGYGTALKPAHEPIWLCKKPNEGTYVDNVLKQGCGAMNIDGSRIGYEQRTYKGAGASPQKIQGHGPGDTGIGMLDGKGKDMEFNVSGRWPANVIVDCQPEEFIGGVAIEGEAQLHHGGLIRASKSIGDGNIYQGGGPGLRREPDESSRGNGLLGPYTRFFVIPKPSKKEKDKGCEDFYWDKTSGKPVRCSRERWEELTAEEKRVKEETGKHKTLQARGNIHVTVKPVRLGMWLIKLIIPHQHPVVLADPFCGSGSFQVAAEVLNIGMGYQIKYYGIDKDPDSIDVARARIGVPSLSLLEFL